MLAGFYAVHVSKRCSTAPSKRDSFPDELYARAAPIGIMVTCSNPLAIETSLLHQIDSTNQ